MKRRLSFALALAFVISSGFFMGVASAAASPGYIGAGKFSTKTLRWRFYGTQSDYNGSYLNPARNAAYGWDYYTNLSLYEVADNSYQALVYVANWGNTGWNGYAYICNTNGYCDNQTAYDGWYWYCHARINTGLLARYNATGRQNTIIHELGHCWSLGHRSDSTSVMYPSGPTSNIWPNTYDQWYINQKYQ